MVLLRLPVIRNFLDQPNRTNSMHIAPTPRIGGLAITASIGAVGLFLLPNGLGALLLLALILVVVSAVDDRKGLSSLVRLLVHLGVAMVATFYLSAMFADNRPTYDLLHAILANPYGMFCLAIAIVWATNLYNFMDGANGLAGLMGAIGFGALAMAATQSDVGYALALVSVAIASASVGFLFFNFPNARVFMGDAGSIPLGFLAATLGLYGALAGIWPWWFPLLTFSPFVVDASLTLAKRVVARKRIWEAHREHYYHRLIIQLNWSHQRTALCYGLLMIICGIYALYLRSLQNETSLGFHLTGWVITYALLLGFMEHCFYLAKQHKKNNV